MQGCLSIYDEYFICIYVLYTYIYIYIYTYQYAVYLYRWSCCLSCLPQSHHSSVYFKRSVNKCGKLCTVDTSAPMNATNVEYRHDA